MRKTLVVAGLGMLAMGVIGAAAGLVVLKKVMDQIEGALEDLDMSF